MMTHEMQMCLCVSLISYMENLNIRNTIQQTYDYYLSCVCSPKATSSKFCEGKRVFARGLYCHVEWRRMNLLLFLFRLVLNVARKQHNPPPHFSPKKAQETKNFRYFWRSYQNNFLPYDRSSGSSLIVYYVEEHVAPDHLYCFWLPKSRARDKFGLFLVVTKTNCLPTMLETLMKHIRQT